MRNLNIMPVSVVPGDIDDVDAYLGCPPFIVAEDLAVAYYTANSTVTGISVAVATCPTKSGYSSLDIESKFLGTYQKSPKNQFQKRGIVIPNGGVFDADGALFPTAVYNAVEKKFIVYYIGVVVGLPDTYTLLLATGKDYGSLVKYPTASPAAVITPPAGGAINYLPLYAFFDKEENLYKLYYSVSFAGPLVTTYLATSKNGYDF